MPFIALLMGAALGPVGGISTAPQTSSPPCACVQKLDAVVTAVENDYVGYTLQIDAPKRSAYEPRKAALRTRAASAEPESCFYLLHEYLDTFADPQLDIIETEASGPTPKLSSSPWSEAELRRYFAKDAQRLDPIEGFWYSRGARYAIVQDKSAGRDFVALALSAPDGRAGEVKAEFIANGRKYRARLFDDQHSMHRAIATISAGRLLRMGDELWGREDAGFGRSDPAAPEVRRIAPRAFVLSLPSGASPYVARLRGLLARHARMLANAEVLIVDLRGNADGNLALERWLQPYYRSSLQQKRADSAWSPVTVSSPAQIAYFRKQPTPNAGPPREWQRFLKELEEHPGKVVPIPLVRTAIKKANSHGPKWFVIFVDNGTRGEAEDFILRIWTSSKVRVVGESTAGGVDYLGKNVLPLPCAGLSLRYSTYARSRDVEASGLNARGISPDTYISPEEKDPFAAILQRLKAADPDPSAPDRR